MFMYAKYLVEAWFQVFLTLFGIIAPVVWLKVQGRKITQLDYFQRETHNLELFRALADNSERLQLASASMLIERLKKVAVNEIDRREREAIVRALISITKHDSNRGLQADVAHPARPTSELNKLIADSIVSHLRAVGPESLKESASPLKSYDWQGASLGRANWEDVDGRGLDLFAANLAFASLRRARLDGAVLREARLNRAVLVGANLNHSNLKLANLCGADLTGTQLEHVKWSGALFDEKTIFPELFDPVSNGLVYVEGGKIT